MEILTNHTGLVEALDLVLQESEEVVVHHCEDIAGMYVAVEESQGWDIPDSDSFAWDSSDCTIQFVSHDNTFVVAQVSQLTGYCPYPTNPFPAAGGVGARGGTPTSSKAILDVQTPFLLLLLTSLYT